MEAEMNLIREAQEYSDYLPDGVFLSEASERQLVAAVNAGRAADGRKPVSAAELRAAGRAAR